MKKLFYFTACFVLLSNAFGQDIKKISLQEAFDLAAQNSKQLMVDSLKMQALDFKKKQAFLQTTIMTLYFIFLSLGLALYMIEFTMKGSITFIIAVYGDRKSVV